MTKGADLSSAVCETIRGRGVEDTHTPIGTRRIDWLAGLYVYNNTSLLTKLELYE